jgi:hypothetical protein
MIDGLASVKNLLRGASLDARPPAERAAEAVMALLPLLPENRKLS